MISLTMLIGCFSTIFHQMYFEKDDQNEFLSFSKNSEKRRIILIRNRNCKIWKISEIKAGDNKLF